MGVSAIHEERLRISQDWDPISDNLPKSKRYCLLYSLKNDVGIEQSVVYWAGLDRRVFGKWTWDKWDVGNVGLVCALDGDNRRCVLGIAK